MIPIIRRLPWAYCLLVLLLLPLTACEATLDEQCQGYGYFKPSSAWIECVKQLEQSRRK